MLYGIAIKQYGEELCHYEGVLPYGGLTERMVDMGYMLSAMLCIENKELRGTPAYCEIRLDDEEQTVWDSFLIYIGEPRDRSL